MISNFDIEYLMSALGRKVHLLDREDSRKFEELVEATYPSRHQVEVVPLEHYMFKDCRKEHMSLPEKYKLPVYLFYSADMRISEIAEILHIPEGTVKTRLRKAKNLLKARLEALGYER